MTLPVTFGPLAGPIPTSFLDTNFDAVGAMGVLACAASGTNAIILTPYGNQAVPSSYANGFKAQFVAANTNAGAVSANVASLGAMPVFKDTSLGPVVCTGGEIVAKCAYQLWYDAALNTGTGGFHLVAAGGTGGGGTSSTQGPWVFLQEQGASGSSVQFNSVVTSTYDTYVIEIVGLVGTASAGDLYLQFSSNNGSTWVSSSNYDWVHWTALASNASGISPHTGVAQIQITDTSRMSNAAGATTNATLTLTNLNNATNFPTVYGYSGSWNSGTDMASVQITGGYQGTLNVNALQFTLSSGAFSSGFIRLYAIANTNTSSSGGGGGGTFTTAGVVGDTRNFVCSFNTTTKLTITATEAIVKLGPGSSAWLGANLSYTLNFGVNGINGLDTGSIQASKFYGIYFIYNPTTATFNTLASLNLTTPTTLPSGYTAYALMAVVPTNSSAQIRAGYNAFGRTCSFQEINIVTGHATVSSLTSLSVAAAVPSIAKAVSGLMGNTSGIVSGYTTIGVASDGSGTGAQNEVPVATGSTIFSPYHSCAAFMNLQLITPQTIYWAGAASDGSSTLRLGVTGYTI